MCNNNHHRQEISFSRKTKCLLRTLRSHVYLLFSPARANATCVACRRARRSCAARVCGFPAGIEPEHSRVHDSVIRYAFCAYSLENNTFNLSDKNMRLSMARRVE